MTTYTKPELKAIADAAREMSDSMTRVDAEKDLQKDIVANIKDKFEMKPADFNKMVKVYHEQKLSEINQKHEEFVELYESVFQLED